MRATGHMGEWVKYHAQVKSELRVQRADWTRCGEVTKAVLVEVRGRSAKSGSRWMVPSVLGRVTRVFFVQTLVGTINPHHFEVLFSVGHHFFSRTNQA